MILAGAGALDPDGPMARSIADLTWLMTILGTIVFVVFLALLWRGLVRTGDDATDPGDDELRGDVDDDPEVTRRWLVWGGVVMPAVVIAVVFAATLESFVDIAGPADADALQVEIVGHQWWYEVRYPGTDVILEDELRIPVDRDVEFRVTSADVIHSFWIPALGGKVDMLPDRVNTIVLRADEAGTHTTNCAEFCGLHHTRMRLDVEVLTTDEFTAWLDEQVAR